MRKKTVLLALLLSGVTLVAQSDIIITTTYSNNTTDNDNHSQEDASSSQTTIGSSSATVTTIGSSSGNLGYRFTGQASAYHDGDMTQTINVTATWTVTAENWEEYSITISPELHAWLNIYDWSTDENDDDADFNTLSSTLRVNGSIVGDTLNGFSGMQRSTTGGANLDRTDSQTLSGYSGNNVFSLQLTGTVYVDAHGDNGAFDNPTGNAVLWGQDGTLNFEQNASQNGFDNYSSSSARNADGLFVDANVTFDAIPEPAAVSLIILGSGSMIFLHRRLSNATKENTNPHLELQAWFF